MAFANYFNAMNIKEENGSLKVDTATAYQCKGGLPGISDALYAIGGKWKIPIIVALADGPRRFTELQRKVTGIAARVLSGELKALELNGLIRRNVTIGYPVVIEYELAPYSSTLEKVVSSLSEWGFQHREKVKNDRSPGCASGS